MDVLRFNTRYLKVKYHHGRLYHDFSRPGGPALARRRDSLEGAFLGKMSIAGDQGRIKERYERTRRPIGSYDNIVRRKTEVVEDWPEADEEVGGRWARLTVKEVWIG